MFKAEQLGKRKRANFKNRKRTPVKGSNLAAMFLIGEQQHQNSSWRDTKINAKYKMFCKQCVKSAKCRFGFSSVKSAKCVLTETDHNAFQPQFHHLEDNLQTLTNIKVQEKTEILVMRRKRQSLWQNFLKEINNNICCDRNMINIYK